MNILFTTQRASVQNYGQVTCGRLITGQCEVAFSAHAPCSGGPCLSPSLQNNRRHWKPLCIPLFTGTSGHCVLMTFVCTMCVPRHGRHSAGYAPQSSVHWSTTTSNGFIATPQIEDRNLLLSQVPVHMCWCKHLEKIWDFKLSRRINSTQLSRAISESESLWNVGFNLTLTPEIIYNI